MKRRKIPDTQLSLFSETDFMSPSEIETLQLKAENKETGSKTLQAQNCSEGSKSSKNAPQEQNCSEGSESSKNAPQAQNCSEGNESSKNAPQEQNCSKGNESSKNAPQAQNCSEGSESNKNAPQEQNCSEGSESNKNAPQEQNCSEGNESSKNAPQEQNCSEGSESSKNAPQAQNCSEGSENNKNAPQEQSILTERRSGQTKNQQEKNHQAKTRLEKNQQENLPEVKYDLSNLFDRLARSNFRSSFHLKPKDRAYIDAKGLATIRQHAKDFIASRLAPAVIPNDGKQTPMRGHPVFLAQHATGCCCRGCFSKWHHIPAGRQLTPQEQDYAVAVLMTWITREYYK